VAAVTLRDVAEKAGVSPGTASRALREDTRHQVAAGTAGRILQAATALGYTPDPAAVSLRTRRARTVSVLAGGPLDNPVIAQLLSGAEEALREAGYTTLAVASIAPDAAVSGIAAGRSDGIIVAVPAPGPGLRARIAATAVPAVTAGEAVPGIPSAAPDLAAAAALAAMHLAALGHRVVGCVSSPAAPLPGRLLQAAAASAGLTVAACLSTAAGELSVAEGRRCCRELLAARVPFTAILAGCDILAAGCCAELAAAGRPCPGSVSVSGAGDLPLSGSLPAPLTTVALPWRGAGAEAARLLIARLRNPGSPVQVIRLAPHLVQRRSTARPGPQQR
jgi:LacI family transcriptional regulator